MASRFEIVNEEYFEELKNKTEIENTKNNTEWWKNVFKKWANERNLQANLEEYVDQRLSQFQLSIQKFSNFALYVINKLSQWTLVKLRINITYVFRSCWNCPSRCATRAISATSENTRNINP